MMGTSKRVVLAVMVVGLLVPVALPAVGADDLQGDGQDKERNWALGWERALVARRQLGLWHVGLSAGPNDRLSDSSSHVWNVDEPDSLQGRPGSTTSSKRESGFVALELGRRVAVYRDFALAATAGLRYRWEDSRTEDSFNYASGEDQPYHQIVSDRFTSSWGTSLALRVSWRPVPFVGLEVHYGLIYEWHDAEQTRWSRDTGETDWHRHESTEHAKTFDDFGFYDLTQLAVLVWF